MNNLVLSVIMALSSSMDNVLQPALMELSNKMDNVLLAHLHAQNVLAKLNVLNVKKITSW